MFLFQSVQKLFDKYGYFTSSTFLLMEVELTGYDLNNNDEFVRPRYERIPLLWCKHYIIFLFVESSYLGRWPVVGMDDLSPTLNHLTSR